MTFRVWTRKRHTNFNRAIEIRQLSHLNYGKMATEQLRELHILTDKIAALSRQIRDPTEVRNTAKLEAIFDQLKLPFPSRLVRLACLRFFLSNVTSEDIVVENDACTDGAGFTVRSCNLTGLDTLIYESSEHHDGYVDGHYEKIDPETDFEYESKEDFVNWFVKYLTDPEENIETMADIVREYLLSRVFLAYRNCDVELPERPCTNIERN